jgi:hypothetical protein
VDGSSWFLFRCLEKGVTRVQIHWSPQVKPVSWILSPYLTSRNSLFETPGEKPVRPRAARVVGSALGLAGFSPGVLKRELQEVKVGLKIQETGLTCGLQYRPTRIVY